MAINVNTNLSAMTAQRHLNGAANDLNKSMERLSSGYKINGAKDDAAGLQISNRLNAQSRGLDVAVRNALMMLFLSHRQQKELWTNRQTSYNGCEIYRYSLLTAQTQRQKGSLYWKRSAR